MELGTVEMAKREEVLLRVANTTDVHKLATSIRRNVEAGRRTVVSCVGVMTINQAVKATAISNGWSAPLGWICMLLPVFHEEVQSNDVTKTIMRFTVIKYWIGD
jgi:stage V sporulation protein SpoVS